jgi:two-component system phosphate regulon sensor histidine kinase PhoR
VSRFSVSLLIFILLAAVAGSLWIIFNIVIALLFCSMALLLIVTYHLHYLNSLDRWLQISDPTSATLPDGSGAWGDVFARLARLMRSQSQSHQQISLALERLQRATSAMPEGVVILDEADRIEWCNPVAEQHFGIDLKRDADQQITFLVRQPQFAKYLSTNNYNEPLVVKQTRHQELILSLQLVPYGDKQKLLISRDITRLEGVETMRRDFVANVSHELRTPLTVIGGFFETVSEENWISSEMGKRALVLMTDQTKRMQRLVEDLLTLSRLENTQNQVREENVNVTEILHDLYHEAESLSVGRHHISLTLDTDVKLQGSPDELRSAFSNLVSNAIRYTSDGGKVELRWSCQNGKGVFTVQDSGIGIDQEHIPRLVERFYRVDLSRSRRTGGTGLGLAIVKHILSRHQAHLEIISQPGQGSSFSAWFPGKRLIFQEDE